MKWTSRRRPGAVHALVSAAILALAAPASLAAQQPSPRPPVDSLRREVARVRATLDSLTRMVKALQAAGSQAAPGQAGETPGDTLAALRAAAAAAAGGAEDTTGASPAQEPAQPAFVGRQRNLQALNPELTVTGDLFGFMDLDDPGHQSFVAREIEVGFQSNLDPYALAKVNLSFGRPAGGLAPFEDPSAPEEGPEVSAEEAYILWTGLPGGLNVTFGRFRQRFGQLNRWHPHALPGQSFPLPYVAFFGEEGLAETGLSVHWLVPATGAGTWEVWTELTNSGNEVAFGGANRPAALGHLNAFWDLSRSTYFELGLTGLAGPDWTGEDDFATRVGGVDFTLSWRPPERGHYREITLRGGAVLGSLATGATDGPDPGNAWGAFANAEMRLGPRWLVGGRWGWTEDPLDPPRSSWLAAPTLTFWQSEFVRLRAEMDFLHRPDGTLRQLTLQTTFAMGPHKHQTY